jgi:hypothetical protein
MKESVIQESIVNFLSMICRQYGFLFFSVPNESITSGKTGADFGRAINLKKMGVLPGVSDLIIGCRGKMYCLEVKNEKGKQSDRQKNFEQWCAECKIPYVLVRSVDDVHGALKEWGIVK